MKKTILVSLVLLMAAGCGKTASKSNTPNTSQTTNQQTTGQSVNKQLSLKELLASEKAQKCQISSKDNNTQVQGVIYIGNGKARGDETATIEGRNIKPQFIADSDYVYTWNSGETQGFKIKRQKVVPPGNSPNGANSDLEKKMDVKCEDWKVDNSVFNLPVGVKFSSLDQAIPNNPNAGK